MTELSMDLSIIYVNWKSVNYLLDSIASVYEFTRGIEFEIIVIENASGDDLEVVSQRFPEVRVFKSDANLGFAGANNLGVRMSTGEYVAFLNPDTKLIEPAFNVMLDVIKELPDCGILGCKLLNADLTVQTSCIMQFPRILNRALQFEGLRMRFPKFWGIGPMFDEEKRAGRVEAVSGACMVMRNDRFRGVGMFSEDYFMYAEDLDLCYKTTQAGFPNYFTSQARIVHYAGKSSGTEWQTVTKLKSELKFCAKHYRPVYSFAFRMAIILSGLARYCIVSTAAMASPNAASTPSLRATRDRLGTTVKALLGRELGNGVQSHSSGNGAVNCGS
jgi:GT2 family glycosyltransferase